MQTQLITIAVILGAIVLVNRMHPVEIHLTGRPEGVSVADDLTDQVGMNVAIGVAAGVLLAGALL